MNELSQYTYQGSEVTFSNGENGENVMVNATQMAKAFGKRPIDWLRTEQAQRVISAISNVKKCTFDDLQVVRNGAPENGGGTWFHEDVALVFAQWIVRLSPLI